MSDSPNARFGVLDPEYAEAFAKLPQMPTPEGIEASRKFAEFYTDMIRKAQAEHLPDASTYKVEDHSVAVDNGSIRVKVITPTSGEGPYPALYYTHGGGFAVGSPELNEFALTAIAVELGIIIASVDYRLAPEYPHPIPHNDSLAGLKWLVTNASILEIDISKGLVVAGDSAGANITATVTHLIRDDPFFQGRQPTGQILQIPTSCDPRGQPAEYKHELKSLPLAENAHMSGLPAEAAFTMHAQYYQNDPTEPTASPLLFSSHANVPPALLQVAGLDIFRDEGILYAKLLKQAGVDTELIVYPGVPHGFFLAFDKLTASKKFQVDFRQGLRKFMPGARNYSILWGPHT
ncbi:hypothetical protein EIP91_004739 [Steccherinum ochraceum]|uniref:Alpha/beta hydrolase fold-3 domain-containing protein n=1 Tax=Steccherinum ochraceum TaxID=92696 RepID=A0A4R0R8B1_9APHY|nr:hypothetical protein EIP91_004739 [Steccherinum ochraceum]